MILDVLERPIDLLNYAFDRIEKCSFLVKCQLDSDHRGQTIAPFSTDHSSS